MHAKSKHHGSLSRQLARVPSRRKLRKCGNPHVRKAKLSLCEKPICFACHRARPAYEDDACCPRRHAHGFAPIPHAFGPCTVREGCPV